MCGSAVSDSNSLHFAYCKACVEIIHADFRWRVGVNGYKSENKDRKKGGEAWACCALLCIAAITRVLLLAVVFHQALPIASMKGVLE